MTRRELASGRFDVGMELPGPKVKETGAADFDQGRAVVIECGDGENFARTPHGGQRHERRKLENGTLVRGCFLA